MRWLGNAHHVKEVLDKGRQGLEGVATRQGIRTPKPSKVDAVHAKPVTQEVMLLSPVSMRTSNAMEKNNRITVPIYAITSTQSPDGYLTHGFSLSG